MFADHTAPKGIVRRCAIVVALATSLPATTGDRAGADTSASGSAKQTQAQVLGPRDLTASGDALGRGTTETWHQASELTSSAAAEAPVKVVRQPTARPPGQKPSTPGPQSADSIAPSPIADPFAAITSPDVGEHCASGLDAVDITEFFSQPIGSFQGADYQRAFRLVDDRVLWTFQDAFVAGTLVHNVGMIQSGRCFTTLNSGTHSWLLDDLTSNMNQWHWILGGGMGTDGATFHLFVAQMNETGTTYLNRTRPTALRRVVLDALTLDVTEVVEEQSTADDLYGWSVTSDANYTYLYSHCYQQFGYDTLFGFGECVVEVKLARIPIGEFEASREFWDGHRWTRDHRRAAPVVDASFIGSANNPAQIRFDGERFLLVEKRDDWWGTTIEFGVAAEAQGPFEHITSLDEPRKCERTKCNTYFASWIPWNDGHGGHIWAIGHNRWNGSETHSHLSVYRPTFLTINL